MLVNGWIVYLLLVRWIVPKHIHLTQHRTTQHVLNSWTLGIKFWSENKHKFHMVLSHLCDSDDDVGNKKTVNINVYVCCLLLLLLCELFIVFVVVVIVVVVWFLLLYFHVILLMLLLLYIFSNYIAYRVDRVLLLLLKMKRKTIRTCYANCTTLYFCMLSHVWWCAWKTLVHLFCSFCMYFLFFLCCVAILRAGNWCSLANGMNRICYSL